MLPSSKIKYKSNDNFSVEINKTVQIQGTIIDGEEGNYFSEFIIKLDYSNLDKEGFTKQHIKRIIIRRYGVTIGYYDSNTFLANNWIVKPEEASSDEILFYSIVEDILKELNKRRNENEIDNK